MDNNELSPYIYKYYPEGSWEYFCNSDPNRNTIRFSPLLDTNDPSEARVNITGICPKGGFPYLLAGL